eukprot:13107413-Ditylum_brightwellii.AAC.2
MGYNSLSYILKGVKCGYGKVGYCMDEEEGGLLVLEMVLPKSIDFLRRIWLFVGGNKEFTFTIPTGKDCDR